MPLAQDLISYGDGGFRRKRLNSAGVRRLTTASALIHTVAAGAGRTHLTDILITNITAGAITATVRIVASGGADDATSDIMTALSVPANDFKFIRFGDMGLALEAGDTIKALASANTSLNILLGGRAEITTS